MKRADRPKYFTRHLLRAGLQCPVKLYYKSHGYPEDDRIRPFLKHAGFNKYQLKKLAGQLYPDSTLINEAHRSDAARETADYVSKKNITLFEASFISDRCYVKVPMLIKEGQTVTLCDVQTKAINPNKHRLTNQHGTIHQKWEPYIVDLAYKRHVLEELYPHWEIRTELLLPDKTQYAENDELMQRLARRDWQQGDENMFCRMHVSDLVDGMLHTQPFNGRSFSEMLHDLKERLFSGEWHEPEIGKKCGNCEFRISGEQMREGQPSGFINCWSKAAEVEGTESFDRPVLDLIGPGVNHWLNKGTYLQRHVTLEELPPYESIMDNAGTITQKQRQTLQVRQAKGLEVPAEIVKKPVFEEISRWQFPLHFLDFEAGNYAVPVRKGRRPYHLVIFQYSCHTLHADGTTNHHQWIDDASGGYANYNLIRELMKVPGLTDGTIVQYSNFEHYALKTIRKELKREQDMVDDASELIEWLNGIVERHDSNHANPPYLADISRLVKNYYYNRYMENSLSIKDVLQSVLTGSETLKNIYSRSYSSSNFSNLQWWQWSEANGQVRSPYAILRDTQGDVSVGRGTEAMHTFGRVLSGELTADERNDAFISLLKYCELDTLAMKMIYEHWRGLAQSD